MKVDRKFAYKMDAQKYVISLRRGGFKAKMVKTKKGYSVYSNA